MNIRGNSKPVTSGVAYQPDGEASGRTLSEDK